VPHRRPGRTAPLRAAGRGGHPSGGRAGSALAGDPPFALGDALGVGEPGVIVGNGWDGEVDGVGVNVMVTVTDGVGEGEVVDGCGDGLFNALPTCAGGGKLSTGLPASAIVIMSCQTCAGRPPP
jgi:hypothetical protein